MEIVSPEHKWRYYFEPVLALVLNSEASNLEIDGIPLPIYPEIHPDVHRFLSRGLWEKANEVANELRDQFDKSGFQQDGIKVEASELWRLPIKYISE